MLSVGNLSVSFSARPLFTDVNFVVNRGERVALVGKNGAGKTTMLRIIAGEQQPTSGNVALEQDAEVGYLPQVMKITDGRTVIEEAETAFAEILTLKSHIESLNKEISSRTPQNALPFWVGRTIMQKQSALSWGWASNDPTCADPRQSSAAAGA